MGDECKHCSVRGNLKECLNTKCSGHDSWYIEELVRQHKAKLYETEEKLAEALDECKSWAVGNP